MIIQFIMKNLLVLVVLVPLLCAPLCILFSSRHIAWGIATLASWVVFALTIVLFLAVMRHGPLSYHLGGWAPPFGIEYRVDTLNAFILPLVAGIAGFVLPYARASIDAEIEPRQQALFYTALLLCFAGLLGVTITGDAFNIFVFLEISSLSTYVLVAAGTQRNRRALKAAYDYLIMGTIGATFFVIGIGFLYMATGTLNIADLAHRLTEIPANRTIRMAYAFILVGVGLKLAMLPLHQWLPNAYTFAPSAVTSFLAATATKVSLYVLIRFLYSVFGFDSSFEVQSLHFIVMPLALIAMFGASTVAIFQRDIKRMFAYSSIGQVGYMLLGIALMTPQGLAASLVNIVNHGLMKGALFMAIGIVVLRTGTTRIADLNGIGRAMPWTMGALLVSGLGLIGVPMTAGFISKWVLVSAAIEAQGWWIAGAILLSSLLALAYVWRIVEVAWFGKTEVERVIEPVPLSMLIPTWGLVGLSLYVGLQPEIIINAANMAAHDLFLNLPGGMVR